MTADHRRALGAFVRLAVTVAAGAAVLSRMDAGEAWRVLTGAPAWCWLVLFGMGLSAGVLQAGRLQLLLHAAGERLSLRCVLGATLRASFVSLVLPSGSSDVVKLLYLRRSARDEAVVAALLLHRLLELPALFALLVLGLSLGVLDDTPLLGGIAVLFAAASGALLLLAAVCVWWGAAVVERLPARVRGFAQRCGQALRAVQAHPGLLLGSLLLAGPALLLGCLIIWSALAMYGVEMSFVEVAGTFPTVEALLQLPVSISGIGVREGAFVHVLAARGAPASVAVAVSLTVWSAELSRAGVGGVLFLCFPTGPGRLGEVLASQRGGKMQSGELRRDPAISAAEEDGEEHGRRWCGDGIRG